MGEFFTVWTSNAVTAFVHAVVILLLAFLLNRLLKALTQRMVRLASSPTRAAVLREEQTRTLAGIVYSTGTALIVALALLMILDELGLNVTPIAAAAGLASLAVGFGGQHLIRDLINGFFIVFEDQYGVGDLVRIGEVVGRVEHLTLRRTLIRNQTGALVTIPNGEIRQIANLSRDFSQVFVEVTVPDEAPIDPSLAVLEQVAAELRADANWSPLLLEGPRVLGVESLTAEGVRIRMVVRSVPTRQDDVARELRRRIKAGFESSGIHLTGVQRVEVATSEKVTAGHPS